MSKGDVCPGPRGLGGTEQMRTGRQNDEPMEWHETLLCCEGQKEIIP